MREQHFMLGFLSDAADVRGSQRPSWASGDCAPDRQSRSRLRVVAFAVFDNLPVVIDGDTHRITSGREGARYLCRSVEQEFATRRYRGDAQLANRPPRSRPGVDPSQREVHSDVARGSIAVITKPYASVERRSGGERR